MQPVETSERVSYDPRKGFSIKNMTAIDTGVYYCMTETDNEDELEFNVIVLQKKNIIKDPVILDENLHHVTKGTELNVTCTAQINSDTGYTFLWTTPNEMVTRIKEMQNYVVHIQK